MMETPTKSKLEEVKRNVEMFIKVSCSNTASEHSNNELHNNSISIVTCSNRTFNH